MINDLRSVWRRQTELVIIMPHRDSIMKGYAINSVSGFRSIVIRNITYPPSFSKTAARTIEPAMGASAWALRSQRWRPYSGICTLKAIIHANHIKTFDQELDKGCTQYWSTRKFRDPVIFWR